MTSELLVYGEGRIAHRALVRMRVIAVSDSRRLNLKATSLLGKALKSNLRFSHGRALVGGGWC